MIVSVHAPCNNSGKTRLAVQILRAFPQLMAAKVSTIYRDGGNGCLQTPGAPCACTQLGKAQPYAILDDPAVVAQPDTDTGRFAATGAPTWWMLCRPGTHAEAWAELQRRLPDRPLLIEGSGIADVCHPDFRIMIVNPHRPRSTWKARALEDLERADLVVANPHGDGAPDPEVLQMLQEGGAVAPEAVVERLAPVLAQ